ncbi:PRC-barrel domain containing protein [Haladaptatus halobius]|uniref:PRC-barrel domain containing protein n=1 Tax=Haladaptatus halobius TaxID=2884875 RepID=UPI001D0BBAF6|nr:PRC-barrel domain containing protein [Haladaptatus halobius]
MSIEVTEDDDGLGLVVAGNGDHIGIVDEVRDGTAHVGRDPDIGLNLGWGPTEQETYPLRNDAVDTITDEAIHLRNEY